MSATLVLETSTPMASIALVRDDGTISWREFQSDRGHNAGLFGPLKELLSDVEPALVIVGSGPGSYSGTRVGIAAAQGVAMAVGCPAVAVPSILAVPCACSGAPCLAIGDARRGSYWTARIKDLRMATGPALCDAAELHAHIAAAHVGGFTVFSFEDPECFVPGQNVRQEHPDATRLWKAWLAADDLTRQAWSAAAPQPLYLKPPHITKSTRPAFGMAPL